MSLRGLFNRNDQIMKFTHNPFVNGCIGVLMLFAIWQVCAMWLDEPVLPRPFEVFPLFIKNFHELGLHFLASTARVLLAILLSVITAAPLGLLLGQYPRVNALLSPMISILYPLPKVVFLPIIYILFGIGDFSRIFLVFLIIFFQILVMVRDEAASLTPELIASVRSLGAGRRALFRFVYLPASIPAILTALRVSVGIAVAILFFVEQALTEWGLGYYIMVESYQVLMYPEMFSGILAMGLLGILLYGLILVIEKKYAPHLFLKRTE